MSNLMTPKDVDLVHVEVLMGSASFAQACRVAAMTLGMVAFAQAATPANTTPTAATTGSNTTLQSTDVPLNARVPVAPTAAALKLKALLPDQKPKAEMISQEQMKVLRYGEHPPVKTTVRINGKLETQWTLHPFDLVRLAREAAAKASSIEGVRVDPARVGAVMIAESAMVSRVGWSANGKVPSFGLAQLEERTARALGVKDLEDPRESALAAARLVAEGQKLANANRSIDASLIASLAYNTSTATRKLLISHYGSALRAEDLPPATQAHVKNMAYGEQRMNLFAKLRDQHEKSVAAAVDAAPLRSSLPPQESTMSTARPSVRSLITSITSDNANQVRLRNNQIALERAGHIQAVPMTSQGLNDMRQAISVHIQRLSNAGNPADRSRDLDRVPVALLLATMGENLERVARSFLEKARTTYELIAKDLGAASSTPSISPTQTTASLMSNQQIVALTMRQTQAALQEKREMREQQALQDHPGFMSS